MRNRNLIPLVALAVVAVCTTGFVTSASAAPGIVRIKRTVEVRETHQDRDRKQTSRHESRDTRPDARDQRWEHRKGSEHRDRDQSRHTGREHNRYDYRERHGKRYAYREHGHDCDLPAHRHWRRHRHDHDGHVHFFFGLNTGPAAMFFGLPW